MSEPCPLHWCEHDAGHDELHRGTIVTAPGERTATIVVTVESSADDGSNPKPVILVRDGDVFAYVFVEWDYLHSLATAAITAHRTFTREPTSTAATR